MDRDARSLYPLDQFYARAGRPLPPVTVLPGGEVPQPYRRLLVHEDDMTPTLEAFHGERIRLRLLDRRLEGDALAREVVLVLEESGRAVEFGAIVIHTQQFPPAAREEILAGTRPLGTLLAAYRIEHASCPQAFFRIRTDDLIEDALGLEGPCTLYGRRNIHRTPEGAALAEIVEILPPAAPPETGS